MAIRTGFIGLGSQGAPMARRMVQAGFPLTLWARNPDALAPFADTPACVAATVADLAAACDHVGICVVNDAGVREVCAALLPALAPGSRVAIHSTVHPDTCRDLAVQAEARGIVLIDAPVSGGGGAAAAGTLTVMVGGTDAALQSARPVLESFAGAIFHLGGIGAGQHAKLVNNAVLAANIALAASALDAAAALSIDRQTFIDLVGVSSGRSYGFEVAARLPDPTAFAIGARLLHKDIGLLTSLLPDRQGAQALDRAARPFLDAALA